MCPWENQSFSKIDYSWHVMKINAIWHISRFLDKNSPCKIFALIDLSSWSYYPQKIFYIKTKNSKWKKEYFLNVNYRIRPNRSPVLIKNCLEGGLLLGIKNMQCRTKSDAKSCSYNNKFGWICHLFAGKLKIVGKILLGRRF